MLVDTTLPTLSIGLCEKNVIIDRIEINANRKQSELLLPTIQKILKQNSIKLKQIDEIYLTIGPGSFTGVRLGLTFAKTTSQMNGTAISTISTLQAIAGNRTGMVSLDARSSQSFAAIFTNGRLSSKIELVDAVPTELVVTNLLDSMMEVYKYRTKVKHLTEAKPMYIKESNATKIKDR